MRKKMYWGIASLILMIGVVGVYFMLQPESDMEPEKKFIVPSEAHLEKARETNQPPREAKDGFTWEWHADQWHEVPIAQQEEQPKPIVSVPKPEKVDRKTYNGPITYHKELLEKHPVKALRQQAQERGHWSAAHIPPFPPDDTEAAEFARELYLYRYYKWTGQTDNPVYHRAMFAQSTLFHAIAGRDDKTPWDQARTNDLLKLTWPDTTNSPPTTRWTTTFTEEINTTTARALLPFELEMSNLRTKENR